MRRERQRGNIAALLIFQCVLVLMLAVVSLDIFSILYARRAVQTAADSAASGALRGIQRVLGPELQKRAWEKVDDLFDQARHEFPNRKQVWASASRAAETECRKKAPDIGSAEACIRQWNATHPLPTTEKEFERFIISTNVSDPKVVDALLGGGASVDITEVVDGVLTEQEKTCALHDKQSDVIAAGEREANLYANLNGAMNVRLTVPYRGRAQVHVRVERQVPTVYLQRFSKDEMVAAGEAAATLFTLVDKGVDEHACP